MAFRIAPLVASVVALAWSAPAAACSRDAGGTETAVITDLDVTCADGTSYDVPFVQTP